jgi:hypothetical protein
MNAAKHVQFDSLNVSINHLGLFPQRTQAEKQSFSLQIQLLGICTELIQKQGICSTGMVHF